MSCPHARIADCPLYVIAHDTRFAGLSCIRSMTEPCKATSVAAYDRLIGKAVKAGFMIASERLTGSAS